MEGLEEIFGGEGESGSPGLCEELVSGLAAGLYGELEQLVGAHGPGAVSGLLPQLVSVLEALEQAGGQVRERDQELELLRDDRLRLLGQYERERDGRKRAEERYMELEDMVEQERKGHRAALSRLDGQSRRLEEKARSSADQLASMEEQKTALLKELSALAQTHSKMVQSYKELKAQTTLAPAPQSGSAAPAPPQPPLFLHSTSDPGCPAPPKGSVEALGPAPPEGTPEFQHDWGGPAKNSHLLAREIPLPIRDGSPPRSRELAEILSSTPELDTTPVLPASPPALQRNTESLFAEVSGLSPELLGDMDEGADLQGDAVQALVMENAQLQDTRMALDAARRHLIARVEELAGERESLRGERDGAAQALSRCQGRLRETEQELSRIRQELEEIKKQTSEDAEVEVPASQRKRFTRAEMARVLTERNLYKERLMELQEAVRRTELLRASREVQAAQMKKSSLWKFFGRLFSSGDSPERVPASYPYPGATRCSAEQRANGGRMPPTVRYLPCPASPSDTGESPSLSPQQQKQDLYRQIRSHIWKQHSRAPVHGWSHPAIPQGQAEPSGELNLPMLAQLRLLDQKDPSTKLWCAVGMGVSWTNGSNSEAPNPAPPSLVWVCSGTHSASEVMVMDATRANLVLAQFVLPNTHVLCAAWLPGYRPRSAESTELEPKTLEDPLAPTPPEPEEEPGTPEGVGTTATVWLGTQEGSISIYSACGGWRRCLRTVQLQDAVHSVVHVQGRAVAALGNGTVAVFHRDATGRWDLEHPRLLDLGRPHQSIRCALAVGGQAWVGYRNRVYMVEPRGARIQRYFEVTEHPESQVRHMASADDGVWVSVRLDPTLRLFHAITGQPLQEIDLTPFVRSMFGPNSLGFSVHVSALGCFSHRLWIGTASGTILTVPFAPEFSGCSDVPPAVGSQPGPSPARTPYCAMESAQVSYHGHRDAVRFFVCVPGSVNTPLAGSRERGEEGAGQKQPLLLVLSGGEGYINLRIGDDTDDRFGDLLVPNPRLRRSERSHLIVWQVQT